MACLEALRRVTLKTLSPAPTEVGFGKLRNVASYSRTEIAQSLQKFVSDFAAQGGRIWSEGRVMVIGKWSLFNCTWIAQVDVRATCAEANVTSGDEGDPLLGRHVGKSGLLRTMSGLISMESNEDPPPESEREESQASWWVLKSPITRTSSSERLKIKLRSGL